MGQPVSIDDRWIEAQLLRLFEQNYTQLRSETGRSLAPDVQKAAWLQVLYYWRRLRGLALQITDTEVKLTLSGRLTPRGRPFAIEGFVDVVESDDRTVMYDFKTHDAEQIRADSSLYAQQLHIYGYVWQQLRGRRLDHCAIIATSLPAELHDAIAAQDAARITAALANWQPIVPVRSDAAELAATVQRFGEVIDAIEEGRFAPPPVELLESRRPGMKHVFAQETCIYCDARFSCAAFRTYRERRAGRAAAAHGWAEQPSSAASVQPPAVVEEDVDELLLHDRLITALDRDEGSDWQALDEPLD